MPLLDVSGVRINFPFEPYPCQVTYMEKVIQCLQDDVNGILESPTGTGKTLCLLCSTLAWQEGRKAQTAFNHQVSVSNLLGGTVDDSLSKEINNLAKSLQSSTGKAWGGSEFAVPKVIYASRTHSQLSQAVQELKRTAYNSVKVSIIGSRDQLCIHETVKKEQNNTNKVHLCRAKVNARTCYYYNHLDDLKRNSEPRVMMGNVVDIEDLVAYGKKNRVCPYYMARELKGDADIIFMPYNYLLDPKTRKSHGVELQGNIIIFDEAHNLEKICEESSSFDLKPGDLATAIEEVTRLAELMVERVKGEGLTEMEESSGEAPDFDLEDLLRLKSTLGDFENAIDKVAVPKNGKGLTKPGMFLFELLASAGIVFESKNLIIDLLDKLVGYINSDPTGSGSGITKGAGLTKITDILKIIFSQDVRPGQSTVDHQESIAKSYKVHIHNEDSGKGKKQMNLWTNTAADSKSGKVLSYWCFSPGHSMRDLTAHGIKCIVLTSGTLSPLSSFTTEMQIPFPVTLENPHVIEKHQVWIGAIQKGPDGTTLNSNYETRFTASYQSSLGNAVVNFARFVPSGLLIFYPSYNVMEKCLEHWKESNIWPRIEQYKQIFVEPRNKGILNDVMEDFYTKINDQTLNGAIFIAVCRGKVSEGLDFSDNNGRAVIITGLPYPPYLDPKVILKMQYLDEMKARQEIKGLSGKEWYKQQASRAVNQAIGRVIRHKEDFGAIILCDTRFASADMVRQLPVWLRPYVGKYQTFGLAVKDAMIFFKTAEKLMPLCTPRPRRPGPTQCQSAQFPPTATRGSARPMDIEPSCKVLQHVPSLKYREEGITADKLKQQYNCQSSLPSSAAASGPQKSLFAALDQTQDVCQDRLTDTQIPSYQQEPSAARRPAQKKKIIIKKRGWESQSDTVTEVPQQVEMSHVNTAERYLAEVKSTLSTDSYRMFSQALVEYKKTANISEIVSILAALFTEDTNNHHLFANFYRFVRPQHKKSFDNTCTNLTGLGTGYKPQDEVSKKRLREETQSTSTDDGSKKVKTGTTSPDCKNTKNTNKTSNACIQTFPNCAITTTSNTNADKQPSASNTTLPCTDISNRTDIRHSSVAATANRTCNDGTESQRHGDHVSDSDQTNRNSETIGNGCGASEDKNSCADWKPVSIPKAILNNKSGYLCCSCKKDAALPFRSMCGHICCMLCWRSVFQGDKLCPDCRQRVRRRHLTQLVFPNPAEGSDIIPNDKPVT